ncbi:hypothetical protein ACFS2C_19455 [Prauserella oleivorans]|uniref:Uncharacterized protein n=2 Tax=Prauserella TaxID=142577 RepID=A0A2V4B8E9_9PSEU|nr:hypothetical protein [Prauserella muralis]PXY25435.1 hypothetical protein BAY60_18855 [Prauserella muralis]TWE27556.1 hypothetical protein FHX69_0192 [Prauserella muralis]
MYTGDCRVRRIDVDSVHELNLAMFDNIRKAGSAGAALVEYSKAVRGESEDFQTLIADLIGDLHHLADGLGVDIDAAIESGRGYYLTESQGQR